MTVPEESFVNWMMPRAIVIIAVWLFSLADWSRVFAADSQTNNSTDFSAFSIIGERNIFNPKRTARSAAPEKRETSRRTPKTESFTLLGTMSYAKGAFAFFDGTRSDYRQTLETGQAIADYKVAQVGHTSVKLASATNELELPVGMQLRREDNGPWHVAAAPEPTTQTSSSSRSSYRSPTPPTQPAPPPPSPPPGEVPEAASVISSVIQAIMGDQNPPPPAAVTNTPAPGSTVAPDTSPGDTLRKLMERREQELNR